MISTSPPSPSLFSSVHCTHSLVPFFSPKHSASLDCSHHTHECTDSTHLSEVFSYCPHPSLLHLNNKIFTLYVYDLCVFLCLACVTVFFWHWLSTYARSPYLPESCFDLESGFLLLQFVSKMMINYEYQ